MKPLENDPRNTDALIKRKEELVALAKKTGIKYAEALESVGDDNVAQIGMLARLMGINATIALNTRASLAELDGVPQADTKS